MDALAFSRLPESSNVAFAVHLLVQLGVGAAARHLGVSERTLRRMFERRGVKLRDYLDARRREVTLGLLAGDLPVTTIATRLGFASSQTFARYARREFGTTATKIRRLLRERKTKPLPFPADADAVEGAR